MASITSTVLTSELKAINIMLDAIGEAPVESVELTGLVYLEKAIALLDEVNREVQSGQWHFNAEYEYPLTRNVDNQIEVPANCLRIDTSKVQQDVDVVQRGAFLYDRKNRVYTFTQDLKVDLVLLLPFCNLPEAARYYIAIRAARKFQARNLTSEALHKFSEMEEFAALAILQDQEGDTADHNILSGSYSVANILERY